MERDVILVPLGMLCLSGEAVPIAPLQHQNKGPFVQDCAEACLEPG